MTIGDRLKELIECEGISVYEFSLVSGIPQSTLSRIINNETLKPSKKNIAAICRHFYVNDKWLLTGVGEKYMLKEYVKSMPDTIIAPLLEYEKRHSYVKNGVLNANECRDVAFTIPGSAFIENTYVAFECGDNSAVDGTPKSIYPADIVLGVLFRMDGIFQVAEVLNNRCFIIITHEDILIRKIVAITGNHIVLQALNKAYPEIKMNIDSIVGYFMATQITRTLVSLSSTTTKVEK